MQRTGTVTISQGTARLGGKLLARKGEANPIGAAAAFLTDSGFLSNDRIQITGAEGQLGGVPVIFMDDARMVRKTAALSLAAIAAKKRAAVKKAAVKGGRKSGPSKSSKRLGKVGAKKKKG
jgi:hypothetical protein